MPAQWTGDLVGKLHNAGFKKKDLAAKLGLHEKYVSAVLNGHEEPCNAEARFNAALDELLAAKEKNGQEKAAN